MKMVEKSSTFVRLSVMGVYLLGLEVVLLVMGNTIAVLSIPVLSFGLVIATEKLVNLMYGQKEVEPDWDAYPSRIYPQRFLRPALDSEIARSQRFGHGFALVLCDADVLRGRFVITRLMNQRARLGATAQLLTQTRVHVDRVFRVGPHGLALLIPECDASGVQGLIRRLRLAWKSQAHEGREEYPIFFGATFYPTCSSSGPELLKRARLSLKLAHRAPTGVHLDGALVPEGPPFEAMRAAIPELGAPDDGVTRASLWEDISSQTIASVQTAPLSEDETVRQGPGEGDYSLAEGAGARANTSNRLPAEILSALTATVKAQEASLNAQRALLAQTREAAEASRIDAEKAAAAAVQAERQQTRQVEITRQLEHGRDGLNQLIVDLRLRIAALSTLSAPFPSSPNGDGLTSRTNTPAEPASLSGITPLATRSVDGADNRSSSIGQSDGNDRVDLSA